MPKRKLNDIEKGQLRELRKLLSAKLYINMHGFSSYVKMRVNEIDRGRQEIAP